MESGYSNGTDGINSSLTQTNSRWWRIFIKFEFVGVVLNIMYR